jgi:hypothetical protein
MIVTNCLRHNCAVDVLKSIWGGNEDGNGSVIDVTPKTKNPKAEGHSPKEQSH